MSVTRTRVPHRAGGPTAALTAALCLADHSTAAPTEVSKALVERAATGKMSDVGPGSPNKLLQADNP
ncbi:hypothetical protein AB0D14_39955 [Streptomyces sp. NPDC048484]|uniref:hypothetical protein n=1 Tax=Streptomyces sp. NPDC048484 TaxID=3155146 RepID=UPI003441A4A2